MQTFSEVIKYTIDVRRELQFINRMGIDMGNFGITYDVKPRRTRGEVLANTRVVAAPYNTGKVGRLLSFRSLESLENYILKYFRRHPLTMRMTPFQQADELDSLLMSFRHALEEGCVAIRKEVWTRTLEEVSINEL